MSLMRRSALAVVATAVLSPAVAATAAQAVPGPVWTSPVGVGVSGDANLNPRVSMGAGGDVAAVSRDYTTKRLTAQVHPAGGVWETAVPLSTAGQDLGEYAVATSPDDDTVIALWGENTPISGPGGMTSPGPNRLYSAVHAAGGGWSAPVALTADGTATFAPAVATAADGRAVALWTQTDHNVYVSIRSAAGTWGAPSVAGTGSGQVSQTSVAFRPDGSVVAVWQRDHTIEGAVLRGSAWSPVATLGTGGAVRLGVAGDGEATVAWSDASEYVRVLGLDDTWSAPTMVSVAGSIMYYEPALGVADDGTAVLTWPQAGSGNTEYWAAKRAADGTWSAPEQVGTGSSETPAAAAGDDGLAAVAWKSDDTNSPLRSVLSLGGTFGFGQYVGGSGTPGAQAMMSGDGRGSAAIVYLEGGADSRVSFLDRSGPALRKPTVPATARPGEPVAMSVDAADAFSAVDSTDWDFGDGERANGQTSPTHTFAAAGTYTVKVTSKDANGFTTSAERTITVAAAPAGAGAGDDTSTGPQKETVPGAKTPAPTPPPAPVPAPAPAPKAGTPAPAPAAPQVMLAHRQKLATILARQAIRTTIAAPSAGTIKVTATVSKTAAKKLGLKTTRLSTTSTKVKAKSNKKVSLRLSAAVRKRAAKLKTLTVTLTVTFISADGHTTTTKTKLSTRA